MCNTKNNYSLQATFTTNYLTPLHATLPIGAVELHTTNELPPAGEDDFFSY